MGTAPRSFWLTADHQAAKEFGRRFWKAIVVFRIVRRVWLPCLVLVLLAGAAGLVLLSPPVSLTLGFRAPEIPDWGFWVAGIAVLSGLALFLRPVRWFIADLRFRFLP